MKVIIDTNILFGDLTLSGAKIRALCESAHRVGYKVCIPKVVVEEAKNIARENLVKSASKINKELSELSRNIGRKLPGQVSKKLVQAEWLKQCKKFDVNITVLGIEIIDYPEVRHEDLLRKAISKKRPFKESGTGYRDALIWENVKSSLEKPEHSSATGAVLISNNHKDFCDDKILHEHLQEELIILGHKKDVVKMCPSLDEFINTYIKPATDFLAEFKLIVTDKSKSVGKHYYTNVTNQILEFLNHREFDEDESPFGPDFETPTVEQVLEDYEFTIKEVFKLSEDEVFISAKVKVSCVFDVYINKSTYYAMEPDKDIRVFDSEWNNHYVAANIEQEITVLVDVIYNKKDEDFTAYDLSVEEVDPFS